MTITTNIVTTITDISTAMNTGTLMRTMLDHSLKLENWKSIQMDSGHRFVPTILAGLRQLLLAGIIMGFVWVFHWVSE